ECGRAHALGHGGEINDAAQAQCAEAEETSAARRSRTRDVRGGTAPERHRARQTAARGGAGRARSARSACTLEPAREIAAIPWPPPDRRPDRSAWHDADPGPSRVAVVPPAGPRRWRDIRARDHREGSHERAGERTRRAPPAGAAVAGAAGIPRTG